MEELPTPPSPSAASIPSDVAQFVRERIDRVETLDVLVLLEHASARTWTLQDITDELRSSRLAAEMAVGSLICEGLVVRHDPGYRYCPQTAGLEHIVRRLITCYRERRAAVVTLIFS